MAEPNGYIQGTNGVPIEMVDSKARQELPKKLTRPATAQVGDYLRIKAIGADGTMEVEAVPAPTGGNVDLSGYATEVWVQELLAQFPTFEIEVVQELPAAGEEKTIYLVPFADDSGSYLEYLYVNGAWEVVGSGKGSGGNAALTPEERSTLIAVVNAIGVFNVSNGQELVSAFNSAWSGDTPDDPDPDEPVVPDDPDQPAENLFRMGEKFVNTTHTSEIEWEDYGCSWKSAGYWSQSCTMIGLEAGKTYTMFADATVGGDAPTAGSYVTAKVVSWKDTPGVNGNGFSDLAVFYPSPAMSDWPGYAEFTVPADVQAVGLAFVGSSTSRTNRIYNVAVYEGSMTARP